MGKVGLAIVGLGLAVEPHAQSLVELDDRVEVKWAASRSPERVAAFSSRHDLPATTDVDKAIDDPDVDAVLLLTPPSTHLDLGARILARGKHLLVEKPLEVDVARAEALVEAGERSGMCVGVVLQHRFRESSLLAARLIREGAVGRIEAATVQVPWWRPQSYYDDPGRGTLARDGGGVLMTQAIHTLDLFRSLVGVGKVTAAQAVTTSLHRMETEDFATAMFHLGNGAPGLFSATTAAYPGASEEILVIGSLGTLRISGDSLDFQAVDGGRESQGTSGGSSAGADPMAFSHQAHKRLIADFLDAIEQGRQPLANAREALESQRLIQTILSMAGFGPAAG